MLFKFKRNIRKEKTYRSINGEDVDVFIHYENRNNARVSIGKKGIYIRIPHYLSKHRAEGFINNSIEWAINKLKSRQYLTPKKFRSYNKGELLQFYDAFKLSVNYIKGSSTKSRATLKDGALNIELKESINEGEVDLAVSKKVKAFVSKRYKPIIETRLHEINNIYNLGKVEKVVLRNSTTNWGSCNHKKGYINISLRLLLAPKFVVDAVLIHELCHLVHPNHSKSFWNLVYSIYPEYKKANNWLKENGHACYL